MRIAQVVFVNAFFAGVITAIAATPALAKYSAPQNGEEKPASLCSAYQQAPDGSWTQLPCTEAGERGQVQTQHQVQPRHQAQQKHAARGVGQQTR